MNKLLLLMIFLFSSCAMNKVRTYSYSDAENKRYQIKMHEGRVLDSLTIMDADGNLFRKKVRTADGTYLDTNYHDARAAFDSCGKTSGLGNSPRPMESLLRLVKDSTCSLQKYCRSVKKYGKKKKVVLQIRIVPSGKIDMIVLKEETLGDAALVQRIIEDVSRWDFGKAETCGSDIVTIPFIFGS